MQLRAHNRSNQIKMWHFEEIFDFCGIQVDLSVAKRERPGDQLCILILNVVLYVTLIVASKHRLKTSREELVIFNEGKDFSETLVSLRL